MLGDAPDAAFSENSNVEAVILKDFPWRSAILVFSIENFLKFFSECQGRRSYAVDVWILPESGNLFVGE